MFHHHLPSSFSGLHFIQQKGDGTQRLVSVCQSYKISEDQNGNICYGDKTFIPPSLGFNRIYYVTERGSQVEVNIFLYRKYFLIFTLIPLLDRAGG